MAHLTYATALFFKGPPLFVLYRPATHPPVTSGWSLLVQKCPDALPPAADLGPLHQDPTLHLLSTTTFTVRCLMRALWHKELKLWAGISKQGNTEAQKRTPLEVRVDHHCPTLCIWWLRWFSKHQGLLFILHLNPNGVWEAFMCVYTHRWPCMYLRTI